LRGTPEGGRKESGIICNFHDPERGRNERGIKKKAFIFLPENGRKKRGRKERGIINCVVLRKEP
jgi:hypothetical protein